MTPERVWAALGSVLDPELDEPITGLGFVASVEVKAGTVDVALRLPTFYCAPNFSYMMVLDARSVIARLPGVEHVSVRLVDHHAAEEITAGVGDGRGFARTFAGETDEDDLGGLRAIFRGKAYFARLHRVCEQLRATGRSVEDLARTTLAELPADEHTRAFLERRGDLGLPTAPETALLVGLDGRAAAPEEARMFVSRARAFATSIEANGEYCRSLLASRYGPIQGAAS